jgi:hypothetical protein
MPPSCLNVETSRSTFATSARNTRNIHMEHLKHVEHTLATCTNPATRHECLLIAATTCPLPRAIPLPLLPLPRAAAGASRRRELRARAQPWGAARHAPDRAATGVKAGGGGGAHSPESRMLAGRGVAPPRYPDEGAVQRRVHGELRVDVEGAGPQHEGPATLFSPQRSSSGGAPPQGQISLRGIPRPWPAT